MKIAFRSNQLCERGTEVALYDYAHYNETILGNESIIISQKHDDKSRLIALPKFETRFPTFLYKVDDNESLNTILLDNKIDILYNIVHGCHEPNALGKNVKNCVHCVFDMSSPRGDVYAAICEWLSKSRSNGKYPWVPHIIDMPNNITDNLRKELNIPPDALVFGRHGGQTTFNLEFVHKCIEDIVNIDRNIYFIFLNTDQFCNFHPRIKFLPMTLDINEKARFVNTCNAMIHARSQGETFGIAIGEFSALNKPVITWIHGDDLGHHFILKDKALYYTDYYDLFTILTNFKEMSQIINPSNDWDVYKDNFFPINVMNKFNEVFIQNVS